MFNSGKFLPNSFDHFFRSLVVAIFLIVEAAGAVIITLVYWRTRART